MATDSLLPQACERCWTRKQKCDRTRPTCGHCRNSSVPCIERRQGTVRDPSNPEASYSYIESLKRRVAQLETQVQQSPSSLQSDGHLRPASSSYGGPTPTSLQTLDPEPHRKHSQPNRRSGSYRDTLHAEMRFLPLTAMAELSGDQDVSLYGSPSLTSQKFIQAATSASGNNLFRSDDQNGALLGPLGDLHRALLKHGIDINSTDKLKALRRYSEVICAGMPFLSDDELDEHYKALAVLVESNQLDISLSQSPFRYMVVYLAIATGMLISSDYRHKESIATSTVLNAYQSIPRAFAQASDLEASQCLIAMAIFSLYSSFGGSAWHLIGLAMTRCLSAGMHTTRASPRTEDEVGRGDGSQVFWTLYILDAILSSSLGRPFSIQDEDISACKPCQASGVDKSQTELYVWLVEHAKLLHDVRRNPAKGMLFHFYNYKHWKETAPIRAGSGGHELSPNYQYHRAFCRGVLAILFACNSLVDTSATDLDMILEQVAIEVPTYLATLEKQSANQDCAFTSLDGVEVFNAAIASLRVLWYQNPNVEDSQIITRRAYQVVQIPLELLTHISDRFPPFRAYRTALNRFTARLTDWSHCGFSEDEVNEILAACSATMPIPDPTQQLMLQIARFR